METSSPSSFRLNFNIIYFVTVIFLLIHMGLNYFASPYVLQTYILLSGLVLFGVVFCDIKDSLSLVFIHFFIEGQGRVVFGYNPLARIMFDLIVCVYILLHVIRNKRIFPENRLPAFLNFLILGHFIVFFLSLFNNKGVGFWISFPMIKVYILPFIVFFIFLDTELDYDSKSFNRLTKTILWLIILNGVLCLKQFNENSPMMVAISPYYNEIGKLQSFTKLTFRPYGTSFIPGGISTYLYLTLGLIFLRSSSWFLFILGTALSISTLILCQVRTAMIQYGVLYFAFALFNLRFREKTLKKGLGIVAVTVLLGGILFGLISVIKENSNQKLVNLTLGRATTIFDKETMSKSRLGFVDISRIILEKIQENPFGLGPGRTHAITEQMGLAIDSDPVYNLDYSWNFDNLWATIAIEFGLAGIFYAALILAMPLTLFSMAFSAFRRKRIQELRVLFIASCTVSIIVLANWGGVGIPYNPVSFMFWFWCALGFRAYHTSLSVPVEKLK